MCYGTQGKKYKVKRKLPGMTGYLCEKGVAEISRCNFFTSSLDLFSEDCLYF